MTSKHSIRGFLCSSPLSSVMILRSSITLFLSIPSLLFVTALSSNSKHAIVVGAGPAGLSSALVLARRHGYSVTVLESAEHTDVYDPTKAYPFLIRERGQKLTKLFPDLQSRLESDGIEVEGATEMVSIPADPNIVVDTKPKPITVFVPKGKNHWIRRHEFIRLLLDTVSKEDNIQVLNNIECQSIEPVNYTTVEICAINTTKNNERLTFQTSLLIGCDGMKSKVRESLAQDPSSFQDWMNSNPKGFQLKKWTSPSTGLKFKTIHINSKAKVPVGDCTEYEIPFNVQTFHTIRSRHAKDPKKFISLGLLPSRPAPTRTLNVIRDEGHEIWSINDGQKLREWFIDSFPRFDFSSNSSLVEQEEFDRFASEPGLRLPLCQYCPELYITSPTNECAIVLVGDAVHCFPPDLGEGVNSGLEDVLCLDKKLEEYRELGDVAKAYGKERGPESKALVKMVRFGAPYQYGQFGGMTSVKRTLWTINFFGRMLLHKLTFGLSPPPVFVQVGDGYQKYSTVMRRADTLTAILWTLTGVVLMKVTGLLATFKSALFA